MQDGVSNTVHQKDTRRMDDNMFVRVKIRTMLMSGQMFARCVLADSLFAFTSTYTKLPTIRTSSSQKIQDAASRDILHFPQYALTN